MRNIPPEEFHKAYCNHQFAIYFANLSRIVPPLYEVADGRTPFTRASRSPSNVSVLLPCLRSGEGAGGVGMRARFRRIDFNRPNMSSRQLRTGQGARGGDARGQSTL